MLLGNAIAEWQTPCNAIKVALDCKWWRRVIWECNCRLLGLKVAQKVEKSDQKVTRNRDFNGKAIKN